VRRSAVRDLIARRLGHFLGISDLFDAVQAFDSHFRLLTDQLKRHDRDIEDLHSQASVWTTMARFELADVSEGACVSVVLATRNRVDLLSRAIASVTEQSYPHWQLVIVDDGSDDGTAVFLAELDRPNVTVVRQNHSGLSSARNAGLDRAVGDYVAYLDDDNVMHPDWLRVVVWAFDQYPKASVVLGCRIIDDWDRALGGLPGGNAKLQVPVFDRAALSRGNIADIGMVAHRRALPGAHFDEQLTTLEDWDLLLRLTDDRPPLVIPAIACLYTTTAPGRLSDRGLDAEDRRRVTDKLDEEPER
jgi:glycosyl transferase family 2